MGTCLWSCFTCRVTGKIADVISFDVAISACGKGGKCEQAVALLIRESGITANVISWRAVISKGGQWVQAGHCFFGRTEQAWLLI